VKPGRHAALVAAGTLVLLGTLLLGAQTAQAAVDCNVTASGVAFGTYDPSLGTPDDSTGSIVVTCTYTGSGGTSTANYTVTLSTGTSGGFAPRKLAAGTSRLDYNLFRDAARTQAWGNASSGTTIITGSLRVGPGVGNRTRSATHVIYGRVPQLQDADTGDYSDLIQVTLTF
jgi:spore coat protein U-like protein